VPRKMSADMLAAIQAKALYPIVFVYGTFLTGPVYVWSGYGPTTWNGHVWQGVGSLLGISVIEEGTDVEPRAVTLTLSGFDSNLLNLALGEVRQGLPVGIYFGLRYASSPPAIIVDPLISWAGRMDQPVFNADGTTASISLSCENRLAYMNVAVDRRYTTEDQQRDWPGDAGLSFVYGMQDQQIMWGRTVGQK